MAVPFLDLGSQQAEVADDVLSKWTELFHSANFVGGEEVSGFEREYADYIGVEHCIGVANGTDALEIALRGLGLGVGDEVIIPANTFIATAEAVSAIGGVPVFVDVDPVHLLIDPDAVAAAVTSRTRAIAAVHLFGQTAPVEALRPIAHQHGLVIVEDAAQAQGARSDAGRAGGLGDVAATSFYPGKNLGGAGDAGAVLTNSSEVAEFARSFAGHGSSVKYVHDRVGRNSRLDTIQAVVLRAKLPKLEGWNSARRAAADRYAQLLADITEVHPPTVRAGNLDAWHLYVVRVKDRDVVAAHLADDGIGTGIHYPTIVPLTQAYAHLGHRRGEFPVAEAAAERILSLPMGPHLSADQQQIVADALRAAVG